MIVLCTQLFPSVLYYHTESFLHVQYYYIEKQIKVCMGMWLIKLKHRLGSS